MVKLYITIYKCIFLVSCFVVIGGMVSAQTLLINNRSVALSKSTKKIKENIPPLSGKQVYLYFKNPPEKKLLSAQNIVLQDYVGNNMYSAIIGSQSNFENTGITGWSEVAPEDKINPYLLESSDANMNVMVSFAKTSNLENIKTAIIASGAKLAPQQDWQEQNKWIINIDKNNLNNLAANEWVLNISPKVDDRSLNGFAIATTDAANAQDEYSYNLQGTGIAVGVGDDSPPFHQDISDRLTNFNPELNSNHGFHTTGTVGGAGIINEYFKGFAPKSNLVSNFYSQIITKAKVYEQDFNVKVTNNSYAAIVGSCSYAGTYDAISQYLDELSRSNPYILNVFAAGNNGAMNCAPFTPGYATVVGSYQSAKNTLVVGICGKNTDIVNNGTSRGPVKDGRIKPEIAAVGHQLGSTASNNGYTTMNGTSMACPNVAGGAALLQERFKQLNGGQYPEAALLKAILMNGATDIGNVGPDYMYGFGRMDIGSSLKIIDNNQFFTNTIAHNAQQSINLSIPNNIAQAKIMLYWNDAPASPTSNKALVNDLDLNVQTPGGATRFPLVLNAEPTHVTDIATEAADHLNNVEQVTINNPVAGNYTININGFNIPENTQKYYVVYNFIPDSIKINYPALHTKLESGQTFYLHWNASEGTTPFTVEYSTDDGLTWNFIENTPANKRFATWLVPTSINSGKCRIRVTRNALVAVSEEFTITGRPTATLSANQCPGSVSINWNAIPGTTKYYVYKKAGAEMALVDSTTNTNYIFTGLNMNNSYWLAVAATIDGYPGFRSVAVNATPNVGNCIGVTAHGDLALTKIIAPNSARQYSATSLTANENIVVEAYNFDNVSATNFEIKYRINNSTWNTATITPVLSSAGSATFTIPNINLSATGNYLIECVINNLAITDPVHTNDTIRKWVKHVANPPINIAAAYNEGFENTANFKTSNAVFAIDGADRFDYHNSNSNGQLQSYVNSEVTISGNRAMSMDDIINQKYNINGSSYNRLTGTFNLSNYNINTQEVRFDFDYTLHGKPKFDTSNYIMVRGNDAAAWIKAAFIDTNAIGTNASSGSKSLNDLLLANGQTLSQTTQIAVQQRDTSLISSKNYGNGLTVDNFKIYLVENDVAVIKTNNFAKYNCGLSNAVPLQVDVANLVNNPINNISISYRIDQNPVVTENIASIAAKDTITYTFTQAMNLSAPGAHFVTVWVHYNGDTYHLNDTIKNIEIHNQPMISSFPYLESFEKSDGYYFSEGVNNTWAHGTPNSLSLNHAANGTKAWKTNLSGAYSPNSTNYLYSPCFDVSQLNNPMLSFSMFYEIEAPSGNEVFDNGFMEYSTDGGASWQRLGAMGSGTHWYDHNTNIWASTNKNYWHVASIPLPKVPSLSLRWVLKSDPGAEFGGIGIDDIHIFDLSKTIFDNDSFMPVQNANINATTTFGTATQISGIVNPLTQTLGQSFFQTYKHQNYISPDFQQYFLPRSFALTSANAATDSIQLKLFVTDSMMAVVRDSACTSCTSHPKEVYQMGVTTYTDPDPSKINGTLSDDTNGNYNFIQSHKVWWIPYNNGYYAQFKTDQVGEYWFNDGGITKNNPLPLNVLQFAAVKHLGLTAKLNWSNDVDTDVLKYEVQRAGKNRSFLTINSRYALHQNNVVYEYIDTPILDAPYAYYRIKYTQLNGGIFYSVVKRIDWNNIGSSLDVYPNPTTDGNITIKWFNPKQASMKYVVYNSIGQKVAAGDIDQSAYNSAYVISFKKLGLASGMYILNLITDTGQKQYKIIVKPN